MAAAAQSYTIQLSSALSDAQVGEHWEPLAGQLFTPSEPVGRARRGFLIKDIKLESLWRFAPCKLRYPELREAG